ncbi:MAG: hypothetical protein ACREQW_21650 [Candidatus Binatia bacterium]
METDNGEVDGEETFRETDDEEEAEPVYETERAYLERLGLLAAEERQACASFCEA